MSLKTVGLSISIGAIFTGATALSATKTAITKLETSIKKIEDKKTTLKIDSKEYELATKKVTLLNNTIDKLKVNRAKMFQYIRCFGSILYVFFLWSGKFWFQYIRCFGSVQDSVSVSSNS